MSGIPSRSKLYNLKPIGLNTPYIESFTSYISRLAETHCINVGTLLNKKAAPLIDNKNSGIMQFYRCSSALNGLGSITKDWVKVIKELTLRNDLQQLTMLPYEGIIPPRKLIKRNKAWCPYCLEEWKSAGLPAYEPLIWSLDFITYCTKHKCELQITCPKCNASIPHLNSNSRAGYCSNCESWLGNNFNKTTNENITLFANELEWQTKATENIGDLLAISPNFRSLKKGIVKNAVNLCIQQTTGGNIAAFARLLNYPKNTVFLWAKGKTKPTLNSILNICFCLNISISDFFFKSDINIGNYQVNSTLIRHNSKKRNSPNFNKNQTKNQLESIIELNENPPPSMTEVANRIETYTRILYMHFPKQCKLISKRYLKYKKEQAEKRKNKISKEVEKMVYRLFSDNIYPSRREVGENLGSYCFFKEETVRNAWKNAKTKLNYDT